MDNSRFRAGLSGMNRDVKKFSGQLTGIKQVMLQAFGVAALVRFGKETIDLASRLSDMAFATGLTTDEFQAFGLAARDAGAKENQITNGLTRLKAAQGDALDGTKEYIEAFETLGISMEQLASSTVADLLVALSKGYTDAANSAQAFNAVTQLLGMRNAPRLSEALNQIATEGLPKLIEVAKEAGQVIDASLIQRMDDQADALQRLGRRTRVFASTIVDSFGLGVKAISAFYGALSTGATGEQAATAMQGVFDASINHTTLSIEKQLKLRRKTMEAMRLQTEQQRAARIQEARDELAEEVDKTLVKQLTLEEKISDAKTKHARALGDAYGTNDEERRLKLLVEVEKIYRSILELEKLQTAEQDKRAEAIKAAMKSMAEIMGGKVKLGASVGDRLARIGGFVGGRAANAQIREVQRQTILQERMVRFLNSLPEDIALALGGETGLR
jgi:hypothetical protein